MEPKTAGIMLLFLAMFATIGWTVYLAADMSKRQRRMRSEEHTSELQSPCNLVCRLLLEKKNNYDTAEPGAPLPDVRAAVAMHAHGHPRVRQRSERKRGAVDPREGLRRGYFFFFNDTATTEIYTLSLHDALPI